MELNVGVDVFESLSAVTEPENGNSELPIPLTAKSAHENVSLPPAVTHHQRRPAVQKALQAVNHRVGRAFEALGTALDLSREVAEFVVPVRPMHVKDLKHVVPVGLDSPRCCWVIADHRVLTESKQGLSQVVVEIHRDDSVCQFPAQKKMGESKVRR